MKTKIFSMLLAATALFSSCQKETDFIQDSTWNENTTSDVKYIHDGVIISSSEIDLEDNDQVIYYASESQAYLFDNSALFLEWAKGTENFSDLKKLIDNTEEAKQWEQNFNSNQHNKVDSFPVILNSNLGASISLLSPASYNDLGMMGFDNVSVSYKGGKVDVAFFTNINFSGTLAICPATAAVKPIPALLRMRVSSVVTN